MIYRSASITSCDPVTLVTPLIQEFVLVQREDPLVYRNRKFPPAQARQNFLRIRVTTLPFVYSQYRNTHSD
ncbi:hypothetical protein M501DRAFT_852894 [Patellaria atrata CBS 101060]|uniref:Uncharacterized protein n=1 Tax=Patellaria atrata CBS 101060 TaxID=1346257 RepID=A0A9P4S8M0_9PEZI|nr:hypothetical protein M501DRAFT_852894 [Patellaria atrata CBS 101060]